MGRKRNVTTTQYMHYMPPLFSKHDEDKVSNWNLISKLSGNKIPKTFLKQCPAPIFTLSRIAVRSLTPIGRMFSNCIVLIYDR
jgi:hypothetical protein